MGSSIGIDLGTTNTVLAYYNESTGKSEVIPIPSSEGSLLKSAICWQNAVNGVEWQIGQEAYENRILDPLATITSSKRFIGLEYDDPTIQSDIAHFNYDTQHPRVANPPDGENGVRFRCYNKGIQIATLSPIEVATEILKTAKIIAEQYFHKASVTHAVITVPAYFNIAQIEATKRAAQAAGFTVQRVLEEPLATAYHYITSLEESQRRISQKMLVYDLGGGTFDVTIASLKDENLSVLAIKGDNHLGGDDFDRALKKHILAMIRSTAKIDLDKDATLEMQEHLLNQCRRIKETLSMSNTAKLNVKIWSQHPAYQAFNQAFPSGISITRHTFEEIIEPQIEETIALIAHALQDAGLAPYEIDHVLLAGGSSWIPLITSKLQKIFPKQLTTPLNQSHIIALGAADFSRRVNINAPHQLEVSSKTVRSIKLKTFAGNLVPIIPNDTYYSPTNPLKVDSFRTELYLSTSNPIALNLEFYEGEGDHAGDAGCHKYGDFIVQDLPQGLVRGEKVVLEATITGDRTLSCRARIRSAEYSFQVVPAQWVSDLIKVTNEAYEHLSEISDEQARTHLIELLRRVPEVSKSEDSQRGLKLLEIIRKETALALVATNNDGAFQQVSNAHFFGKSFCDIGEIWLSNIPLVKDEQLLATLYEEQGRVSTLQPLLGEAHRIIQVGITTRYPQVASEIWQILNHSSVLLPLLFAQLIVKNPPHQRNSSKVTDLATEQELRERTRKKSPFAGSAESVSPDDLVTRMQTLLNQLRSHIITNADLFFSELRELDQTTHSYLSK